jgi:hypothetical protein
MCLYAINNNNNVILHTFFSVIFLGEGKDTTFFHNTKIISIFFYEKTFL